MAEVTRSADAHYDTSNAQILPQLTGDLLAGEDLDALAICRIHSDGLVYMSTGAAANASANIDGITGKAYNAGEPVVLFACGFRGKFSDGNLTPGARLYLSGTNPGGLADAASTGDAVGVAKAINAYDIRLIRDA